jgi:hypothetical protein
VTEVQKYVGQEVLGPDGKSLGTLASVNPGAEGQPPQAIIRHGGFLGLFQSNTAVPLTAAKPSVKDGHLVFALTPNQLDSTQFASK